MAKSKSSRGQPTPEVPVPLSRRILLTLLAATLAPARNPAQPPQPTYTQPLRPQVHFSPARNWTNDPNGLVFFAGEYHLFFQYNPFGDQWGHMSWGHAVSTDLLHWKELPVAIPEADGIMIYTGSVVVDTTNSSNLCTPHTVCLVAIYTGDSKPAGDSKPGVAPRETQNLAVSQDKGRTWTKYPANPVLDLHRSDFRDPAVSWNDQDHTWVMAVALPEEHKVRFYTSPNLKQWQQVSDFGPLGNINGAWECPDLLHVPSSDPHQPGIWALKIGLNPGAPQGGSAEQFFLGDFNGKTFTPSTQPGAHGWTNYGKDDYCAISYNGLPQGEKPVLIGWMDNWQYADKLPTDPWRGQMSLPRQLSLLRDAAGLGLQQEPVVTPLRDHELPLTLITDTPPQPGVTPALTAPYELDLTVNSTNPIVGLRLYTDPDHWTELGFDRTQKHFYLDRTRSGAIPTPDFNSRSTAPLVLSRPLNLHLIVDRNSVEIYAQDGTIAMTDLILPPSQTAAIQLFTNGNMPLPKLTGHLWQLHTIW